MLDPEGRSGPLTEACQASDVAPICVILFPGLPFVLFFLLAARKQGLCTCL